MANLRQAKTDNEIKKLTVNNVKKAYHDLALDYNHLLMQISMVTRKLNTELP